MKRTILFALSAGLGAWLAPAALAATAAPARPAWPPAARPLQPDERAVEALVIDLTNRFRVSQGLQPVDENAELAAAARAFAGFLARNQLMSHTADGRTPAARAAAAGYEHCAVAENLAWQHNSYGYETEDLARRFVTGWQGSPGHRRNMLLPSVTETGVAVVKVPGPSHKYYAVQLFGRPQSLRYSFQVINRSGETVSYSFGESRHRLPPLVAMTHTTCEAGSVVFDSKVSDASFTPSAGQVLTVIPAARGKVAVRATPPPAGDPNRRLQTRR